MPYPFGPTEPQELVKQLGLKESVLDTLKEAGCTAFELLILPIPPQPPEVNLDTIDQMPRQEFRELVIRLISKSVSALQYLHMALTGVFKPVSGLSFSVPANLDCISKKLEFYRSIKQLLPSGCSLYFYDLSPHRPARAALFNDLPEYALLTLVAVGSRHVGRSADYVIHVLQGWEKLCRFHVVGADTRWLWLSFETLPTDVLAFADQVLDLSPNVEIIHGATREEIARSLTEHKTVTMNFSE